MTETFAVKTQNFEGPLEVLLGLIEKRKLFINEISLASITDDYIAHVRGLEKTNLDAYASFIAVAATLILIKSRSLIPNLNLTEEEEEDIGALERRLELYKLIKEIGQDIEKEFGRKIIFPRLETDIAVKVFAPSEGITTQSMLSSVLDVLRTMPAEEAPKPEVVVLKVKSLEETINDLVSRIQSSLEMSFKTFSRSLGYKEGKEEKVGVIVSFLAMLELVRNGIIDAVQENDFDDINLIKRQSEYISNSRASSAEASAKEEIGE